MSKSLKRVAKTAIPLALLAYFLPWVALILVACGLIDVSRHGHWDGKLLWAYFTGNGVFTWLLSPLNLCFDMVSLRRPWRLRLADFPAEERAEIEELLAITNARRDDLVAELRQRMQGKPRGMLFFKWYDRRMDDSVPAFNRDWRYVKTIGISVFNSQEKTRLHFGPVRPTVRLLYNLTPRHSENIFIEVNREKHFWHDDPLYIFDDTIQHRSVNMEDGERMVLFVDLLRPSRMTGLQNVIVKLFSFVLSGINRVFYRNWAMLAKKS